MLGARGSIAIALQECEGPRDGLLHAHRDAVRQRDGVRGLAQCRATARCTCCARLVFYGWPALYSIMLDTGVYRNRCDGDELTCAEQKERLTLIYTGERGAASAAWSRAAKSDI